jgi:hypothetical protein
LPLVIVGEELVGLASITTKKLYIVELEKKDMIIIVEEHIS